MPTTEHQPRHARPPCPHHAAVLDALYRRAIPDCGGCDPATTWRKAT